MEATLLYILIIAVVSLVIVRILGSKKKGAGAVKFEVIYLLIYSFFGGILFWFAISGTSMGILAVLIPATFIGGLIIRLVPLFRLIKKVEDETRK